MSYKKIVILSLVLWLLPVTAVPAQAGCSQNYGHCSIKYDSKGTKWCKPGCFKGTNNRNQGWGR
jgi:hypothetical protein